MKKDIYTIPRGAQFRNGKSAVPFIFFLSFLIFVIALLVQGDVVTALILLPFVIYLAFYVLDIRGVQVNLETGQVREYTVKYWIKQGQWMDMNAYKFIFLDRENYSVKTASFYNEDIGPDSNYSIAHYNHFVLVLSNHQHQHHILLAEIEQYNKAKELGNLYARTFNIPLKDNFMLRLQNSKKRPRR